MVVDPAHVVRFSRFLAGRDIRCQPALKSQAVFDLLRRFFRGISELLKQLIRIFGVSLFYDGAVIRELPVFCRILEEKVRFSNYQDIDGRILKARRVAHRE